MRAPLASTHTSTSSRGALYIHPHINAISAIELISILSSERRTEAAPSQTSPTEQVSSSAPSHRARHKPGSLATAWLRHFFFAFFTLGHGLTTIYTALPAFLFPHSHTRHVNSIAHYSIYHSPPVCTNVACLVTVAGTINTNSKTKKP